MAIPADILRVERPKNTGCTYKSPINQKKY